MIEHYWREKECECFYAEREGERVREWESKRVREWESERVREWERERKRVYMREWHTYSIERLLKVYKKVLHLVSFLFFNHYYNIWYINESNISKNKYLTCTTKSILIYIYWFGLYYLNETFGSEKFKKIQKKTILWKYTHSKNCNPL